MFETAPKIAPTAEELRAASTDALSDATHFLGWVKTWYGPAAAEAQAFALARKLLEYSQS